MLIEGVRVEKRSPLSIVGKCSAEALKELMDDSQAFLDYEMWKIMAKRARW